MFQSIGVTTDFSDTSRQAFKPAAVLARKLGMRLRVIHVDPGPEIHTTWQCPPGSETISDRREVEIRNRLERLIEDEPAFWGLEAAPRLIRGQPDDVLAALHENEPIDLLVVSSHAHDDVKHFVPGSFAARALHLARCPVLVLRSTPFEGAPLEIRRLLVPVDFSASSLEALDLASGLAGAFQASLELLSVIETHVDAPGSEAPEEDRAASGPSEDAVEKTRRLEELAAKFRSSRSAHVAVRSGFPAQEILAEAAASKADLIVMGSRGLSPVEQVTLGSVAECIIQKARCPVLVVKTESVRDRHPGKPRREERAGDTVDVLRRETC